MFLKSFLIFIALLIAHPIYAQSSSKPWLQDFEYLKNELSARYANLLDASKMHKIDLSKLYRSTVKELREAKNPDESLQALLKFIARFQDGHLSIRYWEHPDFDSPYFNIRFRSDASKTIISEAQQSDCKKNDEVIAIDGLSIKRWLRQNEALIGESNPNARRLEALGSLRGRNFIEKKTIKLEVMRAKKRRLLCSVHAAKKAKKNKASSRSKVLTHTSTPTAACAQMAGHLRSVGWQFDPRAMKGFYDLTENSNIPYGIIKGSNGKKIGLLRLGSFRPLDYSQICQNVWAKYRKTFSGSCVSKCLWRFDDQLLLALSQEIGSAVKHLQRQKVQALAVDVTGNGGGSNFAEAAARVLAAPLPWCQPMRLIRNPSYVAQQKRTASKLKKELRVNKFTDEEVLLLKAAIKIAETEAKEHANRCDLSRVWVGQAPSCDSRVSIGRTACGLLSSVPQTLLQKSKALSDVMSTQHLGYDNVYTGQLYILTDRFTGSASELFTALLQDNGKAKVIGERTAGSGCGFHNGSNEIILPNSKLIVQAPNCSRLRIDGSNEIGAIKPDILISHELGGKQDRMVKLLQLLQDL